MAATDKKLYRVQHDESTYYVTATDAFNAVARLVQHENDEGNYSHHEKFEGAYNAEQVGEVTDVFLAWNCV